MVRLVAKIWELFRLRYRSVPRPIVQRKDQTAVWQKLFTDEEMIQVDKLLRSLCRAFCFREMQRYLFAPDDTIADIYRACYPRWRFWILGDSMEFEHLLASLEADVPADAFHRITDAPLCEIVSLMVGRTPLKSLAFQ